MASNPCPQHHLGPNQHPVCQTGHHLGPPPWSHPPNSGSLHAPLRAPVQPPICAFHAPENWQHPGGITLLQRLGIGFVFQILAIAIAYAVEVTVKRMHVIRVH